MNHEIMSSYKDISDCIESIHKSDQHSRSGGKFDLEIDNQNSEKIKSIYEQIGFPTISKVGKSASHHFVTVLLHSQDIEFKKKVLEDMKDISDQEVDKKDMAYLEDKIRIAEDGQQLYGTQLTFNEEKQSYEVINLENHESVNERRLKIGLDTLEDYIKFANGRRKEVFGK